MEADFLFECLEQVPDPRRARGVRHPFQAILRLTLLGLVCGQTGALFANALAGTEGASGFSQKPSAPRHHYLPNPGRGSL